MAETYWDPKNLLQITYEEGTIQAIQCIGSDRHGKRCKWDIDQPKRVYTMLECLSQKKPGQVTTDELDKLAPRCLCLGYHQHQAPDIVSRWAVVVRRAADHLDMVTKSGSVSAAQLIDPHLFDDVKLAMANFANERLQNSLAEMTKSRDEANNAAVALRKRVSEMNANCNRLRHDRQAAERGRQAAERGQQASTLTISTLRSELCGLAGQTAELLKLRKANAILVPSLDSATCEVSSLKADLSKRQTEYEEIRTDLQASVTSRNEELKRGEDQLRAALAHAESLQIDITNIESNHADLLKRFDQAQSEVCVLDREKQRLASELETRTQELRRTLQELEEGQTGTRQLNSKVSALQQQMQQLEKSISECWLHSFRAWITQLRRSRKIGKPSSAGQH